jgi:excisionase family DNA binding protein
MATHTTLTGHAIEFEAGGTFRAFLARLHGMLDDARVTDQEMIGVAYGRENPVLDHAFFPGRGCVTREVLEDPRYAVVADLLARKNVAVARLSIESLAEQYSLSVAQAAERIGVHESAVRQAIAARRLPSWLKAGRHHLAPSAVDAFALATGGKRRGPQPARGR